MRKLPDDFDVIDQTSTPPGWFAYYLRETEKAVIALPVALWCVVRYDGIEGEIEGEDDEERYREIQEIRPFIVSKLGSVMDYCEPEDCTLLCVLAPGIDHMACIRALIPDSANIQLSATPN